jgi:phosphoglycolate phosphatase
MKTKAILLDLDYTLIDASEGIYQCIKYALENMGYTVPEHKKVVSTIGLSLPKTLEYLTDETSAKKAMEFERLFLEREDDVLIQNTKLLIPTMPFLAQARNDGYKLAVVTSKYRKSLNNVLNKFDLEEYFHYHIAGDEVTETKPHPMALIKAVDKLDIKQNEAVYVGDSIVDAQAAHRAKLDFIAVLTGHHSKEAFDELPNIAIHNNLTTLLDTVKAR